MCVRACMRVLCPLWASGPLRFGGGFRRLCNVCPRTRPSHPSTHLRTDLEKYSDQAWVLRYRKERDAALKAHRRQYRRRQILSKFGLARAPVSNEYERFMDVDRDKERQSPRRGRAC